MLRAIIVDDSDLIRQRLVDILSDLPDVEIIGQEGEAHQAVVSIQLERPDLVILDIRLIGGSGIEVLREIKRGNPDIKVVIFTGYPFPQYRRRCMEEGADAFLDKSDGFEHLNDVVNRLSQGEPICENDEGSTRTSKAHTVPTKAISSQEVKDQRPEQNQSAAYRRTGSTAPGNCRT